MSDVRIVPSGDSAWLVEFENRIDPAVNARAVAMAAAVRAAGWPDVRDVVTSYRSVTVYVNPLRADRDLPDALVAIARRTAASDAVEEPLVTVPVCYGGEFGPDLSDVATFGRCSEAEVVARHTSREYRVYMVGFMPGFPYLGTVEPSIAAPRRQAPRLRVPAGSVGIAGAQTGIYPRETPGGWNVVGRTPLRLFEQGRAEPCLFKAGSRVRFEPITADAFAAWREYP